MVIFTLAPSYIVDALMVGAVAASCVYAVNDAEFEDHMLTDEVAESVTNTLEKNVPA